MKLVLPYMNHLDLSQTVLLILSDALWDGHKMGDGQRKLQHFSLIYVTGVVIKQITLLLEN